MPAPDAVCSRCKEPVELDEHTTLITLSTGLPKPTDQVVTLCARCTADLSKFWDSDPEVTTAGAVSRPLRTGEITG
jgi:hypothetical protein